MAHLSPPSQPSTSPQGEAISEAPLRSAPVLRRRYVGPPGRQVHVIESAYPKAQTPPGPSLVCLHGAGGSARALTPLLKALAPRRRVLALDTPGYGGSDRPETRPDLEAYAARLGVAMHEALDLPFGDEATNQVDLLGDYTGALTAAELARRRPRAIRRLVMISPPYFVGAEQAVWRHRLAQPARLGEDIGQFESRWTADVRQRPEGVSLERGFETFVDGLHSYPHDWWAYEAAFGFDVETAFAEVQQPVLLLNPRNHLSNAARRAALALNAARLVELPHLDRGLLDLAADELAGRINGFLNAGA